MKKLMIIIVIVAVMGISPLIANFSVICYGEDGHVAIEISAHDHCDNEEAKAPQDHDAHSTYKSNCNEHCNDVPLRSDVVTMKNQNKLSDNSKALAADASLAKLTNSKTSEFKSYLLRNLECGSFFTPLNNIVLLS